MAPPKKGQKMALGTFLQDESLGSWADEMEDMPLPSESRGGYGGDRRAFSSAGGMGNGYDRRDRDDYQPRQQLPIPTEPPFTAHIGNLSFDASQASVEAFFKDCAITNVRIVEDKLDRKPKGFGYIEFANVDGLQKALSLSGANLDGRMIRVSVAEPPKSRDDGRDLSDWSRKGPLPDLPGQQRRVSDRPNFPARNFDNMSDAGSERGGRRNFEQGDGKVRDFGNWERKGPLSPSLAAATSLREGGRQKSRDTPQFRKASPAWGEGTGRSQPGSQDGSRPPRREYAEKPAVERTQTASELDNQWRTKMRPDAPAKSPTPSRETSDPPSPAPAAPAMRPKLNLQKRTVSEAEPALSPAAPSSDSKASPFGAARPVDTSAKEKEIEEKRELAIRQKKEADDKAKAEKNEERRLAREAKEQAATEKGAKESDGGAQKDKESGSMEVDDGDAEEAAPIVEDKATKPKEAVRDVPAGKANGAWRAKPTKPAEPDTTAAPQEDGWSTVSNTKQRGNKRGNQAARAIAS